MAMYSFTHTVNNQIPTILKVLEPIHFPCLEFLILYSTQIESIEGISRMPLPRLRTINIGIELAIQARID